ncbi:hypothetical protein VTJ49DRAFT_4105 [Mycothermus thermophilus]|uniref:Uncharacterized protein n=1 Tax=Humicola insolens TaxID=85995 RepID=A0ABR3V646_HUMIN
MELQDKLFFPYSGLPGGSVPWAPVPALASKESTSPRCCAEFGQLKRAAAAGMQDPAVSVRESPTALLSSQGQITGDFWVQVLGRTVQGTSGENHQAGEGGLGSAQFFG